MLNIYDWIRRSVSGSELIATLKYSATDPDIFPENRKIGPPLSGLERPCQRCWIYPCMITEDPEKSEDGPDRIVRSLRRRVYKPSVGVYHNYCRSCQAIVEKARTLGNISYHAIVIWGFVNKLPGQLQRKQGFYADKLIGAYIHDDRHFLLTIGRRELKLWLRELLLYDGTSLKGLIQIMPTVGDGKRGTMGEVLARAAHQETRFPMDMIRVRFFSNPLQIFSPHTRDKEGLLTFEVGEFLRLLEMAEIFRALLRPEEQKALHELIGLNSRREEQFYWGRFMGHLGQKAKDMLNAWKIRQWPDNQIKLLYELVGYVSYH